MAVLNEEVTELSGGFAKEIDEGAKELIFSTLQRYQYQYPIKSTIRETVSNGLDSIKERDIALSILKGDSRMEDYYEQKEGAIYKDSTFNPAYYNPAHLSDRGWVEVVYHEGGDLGKDTVSIRDWGVGLGDSRLQGFFSLGYSSKRLAHFALGKFGLGAKSPLSTGIPCYTLRSWYNGRLYVFSIYNHKFESIVPRFNMDLGTENEKDVWEDGHGNRMEVYYLPTTEKNGVEVSFQVKKHHKQQYLDAVTGQLLYFSNVKLFVEQKDGSREEIPVKADILYEDEMIVMSRNAPYSKPHLLLNGVNYGFIDFRELELEEKLGNIGIKVDPTLVSVNPSRESLIWDDKTRDVIVGQFRKVVSIAEDTINKELKETNFLRWMKVCAQSMGSSWLNQGEDNVLGRLSRIVDMSNIEVSYQPAPQFRFNSQLLTGLGVRTITLEYKTKGGQKVRKVDYHPGWKSGLEDGLPIFIQGDVPVSNRKNRYLLSNYASGFILVKLGEGVGRVPSVAADSITNHEAVEEAAKSRRVSNETARQRIADLHNLILSSMDAAGVQWYDDVTVPDDFKGTDQEEEVDEEQTEEAVVSAEERRKLTKRVLVHTPRVKNLYRSKMDTLFEMAAVEFPPALVDEWTNPEVFYGNNGDEQLLHLAALVVTPLRVCLDKSRCVSAHDKGYTGSAIHDFDRVHTFQEDSLVRLFKVSQQNSRYFRDFRHITRFFKEIKGGIITMSNALVRWNTARIVREGLYKLKFLEGFGSFNPQLKARYDRLVQYVEENWKDLRVYGNTLGNNSSMMSSLISHLDNVAKLQLFVREFPDDAEAIGQLVREMFNPGEGVDIVDGLALDTEVYDLYHELLDWAEPVQVMMNMVQPLVDDDPLTQEQEEEIRSYFKYRNCPV